MIRSSVSFSTTRGRASSHSSSRRSAAAVLERFGLGLATGSPSIALMAGSLASLVTPGFGSLLVARGGEAAFRASWFRSGYELFYTPLAATERRAAKSLIDVALDRVSDALGGGLVRLIIAVVPRASASAMLSGAIVCSAGAILAASHLNRWHIRTLETSLLDQGSDLDLSDTRDGATTRVLFDLRQRRSGDPSTAATTTAVKTSAATARQTATVLLDPLLQDIMALRKGTDPAALVVLSRPDGLARPLVSHVIPVLGSQTLGDYAVFALRKVAEEHVGELTDASSTRTNRSMSAAALRGCSRSRSLSAPRTASAGARRFQLRRAIPGRAIADRYRRKEPTNRVRQAAHRARRVEGS